MGQQNKYGKQGHNYRDNQQYSDIQVIGMAHNNRNHANVGKGAGSK